MEPKIFCVGLNKTGTSSLHKAFEILGISSVHFRTPNGLNIKTLMNSNYLENRRILEGIEEFRAYSDWDSSRHTVEIVKRLDSENPGSLFILNIRDLEPWLMSREKHVLRNRERMEQDPSLRLTWLEIDRNAWTQQYNHHYNSLLEYFKDRKDLLTIDITKTSDWNLLCNYLSLPVPDEDFPFQNKASN